MDIVEKAFLIATAAHGAIDQRRKYTNEPYIVHPLAVVNTLRVLPKNYPEADDNMLAAAWLHDVLEDTQLSYFTLAQLIGFAVTELVYELTDENNPKKNRATRKAEDRARLALCGWKVQTIKVADLIDNTKTIVHYDPNFAIVYLKEKQLLLDVLTKAHPILLEQAREQLLESFTLLNN